MSVIYLIPVYMLVADILIWFFNFLPNIPRFDTSILGSLNTYIDMIFNNLGLLGFFIHINTIKVLVPLVIIVVNFDKIYHFIMWLIKKLPLSID